MTSALLLVGTTPTNADLRHQVPVEVHDPLLFLKHDGRRVVVASVVEEPRLRTAGVYDELVLLEDLGREELVRQLGSRAAADQQAMIRAVLAVGATEAAVPSAFPLGFARELERAGVSVKIDDARYVDLRRRKTPDELAGIRRAQAAADAVVAMVRDRIACAVPRAGGELHLDGQPLTVAGLKREVRAELATRDAVLDEFILSRSSQTAIGHHVGEGVLLAGEQVLVDLWPTDRISGCRTDMTRTFVLGEPPAWLADRHALCLEALAAVLAELRPGVRCEDLHTLVCERFEAHGFRTPLSAAPGEAFLDGFPYGLGHGVGLDLHEAPMLRQGDRTELVEGEVLAIEPALYEPGRGGVRIEDVYLVTAGGAERLGTSDHELVVA